MNNEDYFSWESPKSCSNLYIIQSIEKILNNLNIPKTYRLLDVGSGGGYILSEIYNMGYQDIWGIDISKSGI